MSKYILFSNGDFVSSNELYHWGIKGQKWGVRQYQNKDGSLTPAGRERYRYDSDSSSYSDTIKRGSQATDSILSSYGNYSWDSLKSANSDLLSKTLDNLLKDL